MVKFPGRWRWSVVRLRAVGLATAHEIAEISGRVLVLFRGSYSHGVSSSLSRLASTLAKAAMGTRARMKYRILKVSALVAVSLGCRAEWPRP